jgi:hypothetical protein
VGAILVSITSEPWTASFRLDHEADAPPFLEGVSGRCFGFATGLPPEPDRATGHWLDHDPPLAGWRHGPRLAELTAAAQAPGSTTPPSDLTTNLKSWTGLFHGYWGAFPSVATTGAQATQSVNPAVQLGSSDHDTLYSPTLYPTGASCIEVSTIYAYDTTNSKPGTWVGAWDWCGTHGFHVRKTVDASFLSTYTVTKSGQDYYTVQDVLTNATTNTWTAYLYNYQTAAWDTLYTSSGSSGGTNLGWQIDEVYTNYNSSTGEGAYCTQSHGADWETSVLNYRIGETWVAADPSNSGMNLAAPRGSDLGCATSGFALPSANDDFKVTNNNHGAGELIGVGSGRCVDTKGAAFANGTKEEIWDCHNGAGQTWTYNAKGELTVDNGRFCLDATGQPARTAPGSSSISASPEPTRSGRSASNTRSSESNPASAWTSRTSAPRTAPRCSCGHATPRPTSSGTGDR